MKEINIEDLIEIIPDNRCLIITIEDDLTEGIYSIESIKDNIKEIIEKKVGYCFNIDNKKYIFWRYNRSKKTYNYAELMLKDDLYLHNKLKSDLQITKIPNKND